MAHLFPLIATWFILSIYYISLYSRSTTHLPKFVCLESSISCLSSSGRNLDTSLPPNQPYDLSRNVSQPSTPMEGFFPIRIPFFRGSTPPLIFRPKNLVPSSRWIIPCPMPQQLILVVSLRNKISPRGNPSYESGNSQGLRSDLRNGIFVHLGWNRKWTRNRAYDDGLSWIL